MDDLDSGQLTPYKHGATPRSMLTRGRSIIMVFGFVEELIKHFRTKTIDVLTHGHRKLRRKIA